MLALLDSADLTEVASAWRLGNPDRVNSMAAEATAPTMVHRGADAPVTHFPAFQRAPGFSLVKERIMRLGGRFGPAHGPRLDHPRLRAERGPVGANARPVSRAVTQLPAGLTPTAAWWESSLTASDVYAAI